MEAITPVGRVLRFNAAAAPPPEPKAEEAPLQEPLTYFAEREDVNRPTFAPLNKSESVVAYMNRMHALPVDERQRLYVGLHGLLVNLDVPDSGTSLLATTFPHWRRWARTGWEPRRGETAAAWATRLSKPEESENRLRLFTGIMADQRTILRQQALLYPYWV